jgi:ribose/xylose/arabinose/galactoside ABC-type transport system permease subunit
MRNNLSKSGRNVALLCAGGACVLALAEFFTVAPDSVPDQAKLLLSWAPQITVGLVALAAISWLLGARLGPVVVRRGIPAFIVGLAFGLVALEGAAVVGASVSLILYRDAFVFGTGPALFSYLINPLYWITLFGAAPAMLLGFIYVSCTRKIHDRA